METLKQRAKEANRGREHLNEKHRARILQEEVTRFKTWMKDVLDIDIDPEYSIEDTVTVEGLTFKYDEELTGRDRILLIDKCRACKEDIETEVRSLADVGHIIENGPHHHKSKCDAKEPKTELRYTIKAQTLGGILEKTIRQIVREEM